MTHDPNPIPRSPPATNRRRALALGLIGVAGAGLARSVVRPSAADAQPAPKRSGACLTLMPEATEGPFYFDPKLVRADITEGRPGAPIRLRLDVIDAGGCTPLSGARVDVWHADASGQYSGYRGQADNRAVDTTGKTFMRGTQVTDAEGRVLFTSVFPGWYQGRTAHIHFKVLLDRTNLVTGQLYFPDAIASAIYAGSPAYRRPRQRDTLNANDGLARAAGRAAMADVEQRDGHHLASLTIAVRGRA